MLACDPSPDSAFGKWEYAGVQGHPTLLCRHHEWGNLEGKALNWGLTVLEGDPLKLAGSR